MQATKNNRVKLVLPVFKLILIVRFWSLQSTYYSGMSHRAKGVGNNLVSLYGACPCCMPRRRSLRGLTIFRITLFRTKYCNNLANHQNVIIVYVVLTVFVRWRHLVITASRISDSRRHVLNLPHHIVQSFKSSHPPGGLNIARKHEAHLRYGYWNVGNITRQRVIMVVVSSGRLYRKSYAKHH